MLRGHLVTHMKRRAVLAAMATAGLAGCTAGYRDDE